MRARTAMGLVAGMGLLFILAVVLLIRLTEPGGLAGGPVPAPAPAPPPEPVRESLPQHTITPPEVADPAEALALELRIEARSRYRSLRDGFQGPLSEASRLRLDPALRALWPGRAAFAVTCRGRVCRVEGPGAPGAWQAALQADPGVAALADQVVLDPDGLERPAFVLVSPGRAGSGDDLLGGLARQLLESDEALACLTGPGTVVYDLQVDESGVTYREGGTAPQPVIDCVGRALADLVTATRVPPATKAGSRRVTLGAAR
ncbi:MAG: hypothetical protein IPQ24_17870 [Anaeromyxobacter sp.]|nr:hypothetical protein [Anaeromyxobacter sp.]